MLGFLVKQRQAICFFYVKAQEPSHLFLRLGCTYSLWFYFRTRFLLAIPYITTNPYATVSRVLYLSRYLILTATFFLCMNQPFKAGCKETLTRTPVPARCANKPLSLKPWHVNYNQAEVPTKKQAIFLFFLFDDWSQMVHIHILSANNDSLLHAAVMHIAPS